VLQKPLLDKLSTLQLHGMRQGLEEQALSTQYADLSFEDRLGLLVDRECTRRDNSRLDRILKAARFQYDACIEDVDFSASRGMTKRNVLELAQCEWIRNRLNVLIVGPTGAGKTFLACALGQSACRFGITVKYIRLSRLLQEIAYAQADGSYPKLLDALAKASLLILDDWLRDPLTPAQARDLLEVFDDRYNKKSTLVVAQVPVTEWHERIPDPTLADAILDRLVHNAHRITLKGESQRKLRSPLAETDGKGV